MKIRILRVFFVGIYACFMGVLAYGQTQVAPMVNSRVTFANSSGAAPCNGCLLDTFAAGTTTPLVTYSESTGTTPNSNPVTLGSDGSAVIYMTTASYKFRLRTAAGATIWTQDNVTWSNLAQTLNSLALVGNATINSSTAATSGANQSGPNFIYQGNFWNGSASAADSFSCGDVLGTGTNPTATWTCTHSGSSGTASATFNFPLSLGTNGLTASSTSLTGAVSGGVGNAAGGALNAQKPASSSAIFMGRFVDAHGDTNNQLLGFNVEQMVNPTSSVSYQNSAHSAELFIPIGNTQNFTGTQVTSDFAFIDYGSGSQTLGVAVIGEAWNSGPATSVLELDGVSGGCHNGSVTAGIPVQTPTGNGSVANCRAVAGSVTNSSSGTITNAVVFFAGTPTNTGGGSIGTDIGLQVSDQTAGSSNFAIKTGLGLVSLGDATTVNSTFRATGNVAVGGTVPLANIGIAIQPTGLTGTGQTGMFVFPSTTSAATAEGDGIQVRADVAASTTQTLNIGLHVNTPSIGSSGAITNWNGIRIDKAPTVGSTACSLLVAGSTSGTTCFNPAAAASGTITLPAATGTVALDTSQTCGTTTTCSATNVVGLKTVYGSAPLVSGTPSVATVTGFSPAFTSSSSFVCTATNATTQANPIKVVNASSSSITLTGPATVTDTVNYICIGT